MSNYVPMFPAAAMAERGRRVSEVEMLREQVRGMERDKEALRAVIRELQDAIKVIAQRGED
jgi:hypothetical protein